MNETTLLADIGGTNARFTLLDATGMRPLSATPLDRHSSIEDAITTYLRAERLDGPPRAALLAVAGPVNNNSITLTNRGWTVDGAAVSRTLGIPQVRVLNDFEALAWSLPELAGDDLFPLGGGAGLAGTPLAVLGPGTGLGVGAFLPPDRVLPGEGGHVSLAAADEREAAVVAVLRRRFGHVSGERVLSGPGLVSLHEALAELDGLPPPEADAVAITSGAAARSADTLALFCAMLGGFAGNVALTYGARGGVFIGGGILPRIPQVLTASSFRQRFEAKGRFRDWLAPVPAWLIMRPDAALMGLAALARRL
jgi:glucokinase